MESMRSMFITVGTTEFDQLVEVVDSKEFLELLRTNGYNDLRIQFGRGVYEPKVLINSFTQGIQLEIYRFKPTLDDDMKRADLIISHCGAGSILEAVKFEKDLVVVVNDTLQDNHQTELADAMSSEGYCISTTPLALLDVLRNKFNSQASFSKEKKKRITDIPITDPDHFEIALSGMYSFST